MSIKYKIIVPLALGALLAAGCNQVAPAAQNTQPDQTAQSPAKPAAASQKFSDQTYYNNAYLISDPVLSTNAKTALTGFTMDKQTLTNGNTQITLKTQKAGYHDQVYTLHAGDQLYFIEKFLGDDKAETNEEQNTIDDSAVVVDSQGNVVGQPQTWINGQ